MNTIFFDLDGTVYSHSQKKVPESTIETLQNLREMGIRLVIATGRSLMETRRLLANCFPFDGYITLNGQLILDQNYEILAENAIDSEDMVYLKEQFETHATLLTFVEKDRTYVNYVDDCIEKVLGDLSSSVPDIGEYEGDPVYQLMLYGGEQKLEEVMAHLKHCKATSWHPLAYDIIPANGGKVPGIETYLSLYGISQSETMAVGDGENDLDMLAYVNVGVAMGNAIDAVKKSADYVTDDIDQDGIKNVMEHYFGAVSR